MKKAIITLACLLLMVSCTEDTSKSPLENAWTMYENAQYQAALDSFITLIPTEGSDAFIGAGWCGLQLGLESESEFYFGLADSVDSDALAGLGFTAWVLDQSELALSKTQRVLASHPNYVFSHDKRITGKTLLWIQASSYYRMNHYNLCFNKLKTIDVLYNPAISTGDSSRILLEKLQQLGIAY